LRIRRVGEAGADTNIEVAPPMAKSVIP